MTVVEGWLAGENMKSVKNIQAIKLITQGISVNSKATIKPGKTMAQFEYLGNKTECALLAMASKLGVDYLPIREKYPVVKQYAFNL